MSHTGDVDGLFRSNATERDRARRQLVGVTALAALGACAAAGGLLVGLVPADAGERSTTGQQSAAQRAAARQAAAVAAARLRAARTDAERAAAQRAADEARRAAAAQQQQSPPVATSGGS